MTIAHIENLSNLQKLVLVVEGTVDLSGTPKRHGPMDPIGEFPETEASFAERF